jgi:hypothetical protein
MWMDGFDQSRMLQGMNGNPIHWPTELQLKLILQIKKLSA